MKEYKVIIEETVDQEFKVNARSKEEAYRIAAEKYYQCEFVLSPGEAQCRKMSISSPNGVTSGWYKF